MNRKENIWTVSGRRPSDTHPAKPNLPRGVSNIAGRNPYSRTKVTGDASSNLSSSKRVPGKEDIHREDQPQRVNILNDKQNGSQYGYHFVSVNDRIKEKEEWAKEQKRQQVERIKLIERVDQSKKDFA